MAHGGLICALGYHLGVKNVIPNCSMVCMEFSKAEKDFIKLIHKWEFA